MPIPFVLRLCGAMPLPLRLWSLVFFVVLSNGFELRGQCPADITVTAASALGATGTWTAPASGGPWLVEITATGGGGGGNAGTVSNTGGSGAVITARYVIQNGQTLFAIAGGPGVAGTGDNGGGGGGGSGVVNCGNPSNCATGTILLLAAGGLDFPEVAGVAVGHLEASRGHVSSGRCR